MKSRIVSKISKTVYQQFPEMRGVSPRIEEKTNSRSKTPNNTNYKLTFNSVGVDPLGRKTPKWVRVTANKNGKILKLSTSR
jgi:hypothetical protein